MAVKLFGILNITPDSFSDGSEFDNYGSALKQAALMIEQGADYIDVGGEATNPWAKPITAEQEWERVKKILSALIDKYPGKVSIDTRNPSTAQKFLELGGSVLNDVSGFRDLEMIALAAKHKPLCVVNHFPADSPEAVHKLSIDSLEQVKADLLDKHKQMIEAGVSENNIVLDPGIGFGKSMRLNKELVSFAKQVPGIDVMIGYSRKRFLGKDRFELAPNLEAARIAADSGARYLRVHDVLQTKQHLA